MTRILLAEHSPHAQRMGERILREEGYTVVTVTDGESAMLRLRDVKPHLVLADISLSGFTGFEVCEYIRNSATYPDTRVVLTVGALELLDPAAVERVKADSFIRKPFEASALLEIAAKYAPSPAAVSSGNPVDRTQAAETAMRPVRSVVVLDPEQVRAAVTVALDEAMEPLIQHVTERVLKALAARK
jgi:CheY-like chemotaxis protein